MRRARSAYYGLIAYLDEKIGSLLDALEETGLRENTVVVYTSDHGESLGEHGMWYKCNLYEQSVRIPLDYFVARKSAPPPRAGARLI